MTFRVRSPDSIWFKFWLAARLGKTVRQLEQEMTPIELDYWKLWYVDFVREPFRI